MPSLEVAVAVVVAVGSVGSEQPPNLGVGLGALAPGCTAVEVAAAAVAGEVVVVVVVLKVLSSPHPCPTHPSHALPVLPLALA